MPRYSIVLTAGDKWSKPMSRKIWAEDDQEAIDYAKDWLALVHRESAGQTSLNTWGVHQGVPPYSKHKTIAMGEIRPRA